MAAEAARKALFSAVRVGDAERVAGLLDADPLLLSCKCAGRPLLSWAEMKGHVGVVRVLLERGADVDAPNSSGNTALHCAASRGHEEIVSLFLSHGADISRRGYRGMTPLSCASFRGHASMVRLLLRCLEGHGLDDRDGGGRTALWYACSHGHVDTLRILLLAGADHAIADNAGRTAQQIARQRGFARCTAMIQWWEGELRRAYVLHKARTLHDGTAARQQAPAAPVPAYLSPRVQGGGVMPLVEVGGMQQDGQEGSAKRVRGEVAQDHEEERMCAMVGLVVKDLAAELYIELLAGFRQ